MPKGTNITIGTRLWLSITLIVVAPVVAVVIVVLVRLDEEALGTLAIILLVLLAVLLVGGLFIGLIASLAVVIRKLLADDQRGDLKEMVLMSKLFQPSRVTNQYRPVAGGHEYYAPQMQQMPRLPNVVSPGYGMTDLVGDEDQAPAEVALE